MKERIHIYHTNDLHSHFEKWPRIEAFLKQQKALHEAAGEEVFIFDCGDFADRSHPFTEGTMGKGNTQLLNAAGYTAATIGNNEGITLNHQALDELYEKAKFDVIAANLYEMGRKKPSWALPYRIYETKAGTKIGVTAITAYYRGLYELLDWELTEPFTELRMQVNTLKEQSDMIILLSHLGIYDDEKIAELFPEVDLVLGAHTHHLLPDGKEIGNTVIAAAGKFGQYVGYVEARLHENIQMSVKVYETAFLPSVVDETSKVEELSSFGKKQLDVEVASIPHALSFSWKASSQLPALLCEAVHEWCQADCTMINSGLVLTELSEGRVTKYDLHRMLPHPINPCIVELTGAELKEILFHAEDEMWQSFEFKGLGFRGKVMGKFIYSQIEVDRQSHLVKIAGEDLDSKKMYKLATLDMFTFGKFFPEIQRSEQKEYFMPEFLRDIMEWKLKQLYRE